MHGLTADKSSSLVGSSDDRDSPRYQTSSDSGHGSTVTADPQQQQRQRLHLGAAAVRLPGRLHRSSVLG